MTDEMKSLDMEGEELKRLRNVLAGRKIKEIGIKSPYETYRFEDKKEGILVIAYKTGRLVYRESDMMKDVFTKVLREEKEYDYVLGTDEAGKGEWFGPLVVGCTALTPEEIKSLRQQGIKDSKKMSKSTLQDAGRKLCGSDILSDFIILSPERYNVIYEEQKKEGKTLNDVMAWAHTELIKGMLSKLKYDRAMVVIDMFDYKKTEERLRCVEKKGLVIVQKSGGESEIPVAAASIMAKYLFEKEVDRLNREYKIDLRNTSAKDIPPGVLPKVAKLHFRNVS